MSSDERSTLVQRPLLPYRSVLPWRQHQWISRTPPKLFLFCRGAVTTAERTMEAIVPGLVAELTHIVHAGDTAQHLGSGAAAVLATPTLILWLEQTAVAALALYVPDGAQTVGIHVDVQHVAATPVGMTVRTRAEVRDVSGRRVVFGVQAWDAHELVGEGTHTRVLVDTARFLARAHAKGHAAPAD